MPQAQGPSLEALQSSYRWKMKKALRNVYEAAVASTQYLPGKSTIEIRSRECGLFGDVFMTLNGVRFAELNNLACEIAWDDNSLYFDPKAGSNAWSYYFRNSEFDFRRSKKSPKIGSHFRFLPDARDFVPYSGKSVRRSVGVAIDKWCVLRPEISDIIDAQAERFLAPRHNLAMHIRLTDAARGHEDRKAVQLEHFIAEGRDWLEAYPEGKIFLATDDVAVVDSLKSIFGDRLVQQDCIRSSNGQSIHGHYDGGVAGSPFQKGLEVLVDAWLMAKCDHLIRTHSRVTCFSLSLNPTQTFTDLEIKHFGVDHTPWLAG